MEIINDTTFEKIVLNSDKPVLVDFFATWCGPCRQLLPIISELADEMKDRVTIVKMDVDESPNTPEHFGIQTIPTLILFKNGQPVATHTGALLKHDLQKWIETYL